MPGEYNGIIRRIQENKREYRRIQGEYKKITRKKQGKNKKINENTG